MSFRNLFSIAVERLAPGYEFDTNQKGMLGNWSEEDFQKQIDWLPDLVENAREQIVRGLDEVGCGPEDVTNSDCLRSYLFQTPARKYWGSQDNFGLKRLSPEELFAIGERSAKRKNRDPIVVLYETIFGRDPDTPGYNFYTKLLGQKVPLSVLVEDMERNKAQGAS